MILRLFFPVFSSRIQNPGAFFLPQKTERAAHPFSVGGPEAYKGTVELLRF